MAKKQDGTSIITTESALFQHTSKELARFVKAVLKEAKVFKENGRDKMTEGDYGIIPYTNKKSLLKPGAEKLLKLFNFVAKMDLVKEVEDFSGGFVYYKYKCTITHGPTGTFIADAVRSCNNHERKHSDKNVYDVANTIEAVAQKRALVAATVQATMASEIFDADISETDTEAPHASVTKDEDPKRILKFKAFFAACSDRGISEETAKVISYTKLRVKSMKDISTDDIVRLTAGVIETYKVVPAGQKPQLIHAPEVSVPSEEAQEDEIDDGPIVYECKGPVHHVGERPKTTFENPWCSKKCEDDYCGKAKGNTAFENFIKTGGKKKSEAGQVSAGDVS